MIVGLVGKPSTGKSTFFKALTLIDVAIASYPFTTIEPNKGFGFVRIDCVDKDFGRKCNPRFGFCVSNQRFVPVELVDVAGLVPGAHEGKGLGNKFLDDLRQADVLVHVVDSSGSVNSRGENVELGSYDPLFDIKFLEFEIDMWYFSVVKKGWERLAKQIEQEKKSVIESLAKQVSGLNATEGMVKDVLKNLNLNHERPSVWSEEDLHNVAVQLRKITKPIIIAANKCDLSTSEKNVERIKKEFPDLLVVSCCADAEIALKEASKKGLVKYLPGDSSFEIVGQLNEKQKNALDFIRKGVLEKFGSTGVQKVLNSAVFDFLKYFAVFPGGVNKLEDQFGNVLPDCFLMPENSSALDFAFKIHTDLGNKFICAIDVKTKLRVGRDHKLKHRDVIEIVSR